MTLLLGLGACVSSPPPPPPPAAPLHLSPSIAQARDVVVGVQARLVELAKAGAELSFEERRSEVMEMGREDFDLPLMAQLSYGRGWPDLTASQRRLFIDTFTLFRCSAVAKLNSRFRGQAYRFKGYEQLSDERVLIRTGLRYPNRALEIAIDYQLVRKQGGWQVVDRYSPSSVSEIAMHRSEYRTLLEKEGFTGLIRDMDRRIKGYASQ